MRKIRKWPMLLLAVSATLIVWGCSSEFDDYWEEQNTLKEADATMRSGDSECEMVFQSREFKNYISSYQELSLMVQNVLDKTAEEDTEELCELAQLYMSDHIKYQKLFEYKTQSVLGNDSIRLKELYLQLKADYDILMGNKTLSKIIKENEELMSEQMLINSNENFMTGQISVPMLKGRSEQDKLAECRSLCRDEYDAKMRNIQDAYRCETVLNLLSCVLSAGVVIEENLLLQLGLIYNLHREEEQAKSELDICLGRCDLDYGD